jgi:hypothetical protein
MICIARNLLRAKYSNPHAWGDRSKCLDLIDANLCSKPDEDNASPSIMTNYRALCIPKLEHGLGGQLSPGGVKSR